MKKSAIIMMLVGLGLFAQDARASRAPGELVWLGIDYTLVKFIGVSDHFSDLRKIQDHYFRTWNELIMVESDKYDLRAAFGAREIRYEMEQAITRSEHRDMDEILQTGSYTVDESRVKNVIKQYTGASLTGTGALIVMETLDKLDEKSTMWLALFDLSTGEIMHLSHYSGSPGGFGFRNYWARSYYNVLKNLRIAIY